MSLDLGLQVGGGEVGGCACEMADPLRVCNFAESFE